MISTKISLYLINDQSYHPRYDTMKKNLTQKTILLIEPAHVEPAIIEEVHGRPIVESDLQDAACKNLNENNTQGVQQMTLLTV